MKRTKLLKAITTPVIITNIILLFMQVFTNILSKPTDVSVMLNLIFLSINAFLFLLLLLAIVGDRLSISDHKGRLFLLLISTLMYGGFAHLYHSRPAIMKQVPTYGLLDELSAKNVYDLPTLEYVDDEYWYLNNGTKIERNADVIAVVYNPTCHLCQKSSHSYTKYEELAKSNNKQIFVVNVATKVGSSLAQAHKIKGYPQMIHFKDNKHIQNYDLFDENTHKLHTIEEITSWILK